jgi:hypothetical protein
MSDKGSLKEHDRTTVLTFIGRLIMAWIIRRRILSTMVAVEMAR